MRDWRFWCAVGVVSSAVAAAIRGMPGLVGLLLGLAAGGFGILGLVLMIRLMAGRASAGRAGNIALVFPLLAIAAKIPIFVVLGVLAKQFHALAFGPYLAGIVLVYSATVARAAAEEPRSTHFPNGSSAD